MIQGDPISAYLFIIALETVFIMIKSNQNIKGINILKIINITTYILCTQMTQHFFKQSKYAIYAKLF